MAQSTNSKKKSSNFKKDGYRTKKSIKSILEKKRKRNLNTYWRIRNKHNLILGFVKAYNKDGFIIKVDKTSSYTKDSSITFIISHPFIKEKYEVDVRVLWRHKVNDLLDELGVRLENKDAKLDGLFSELELFYLSTVDTIGSL